MGQPVDLTGQRFGKLVAVSVASSKPRKWLCRCDCGSDTTVCTRDLRSGNTQSCGCSKREFEDLTNGQFGKLTAVEYAGNEKGYSMWRCVCECGREVVVRSVSLKDGNTKSCGCLVLEIERHASDTVDGTRLSMLNAKPPRTNTTGVRGVSYSERRGRFEAYIKFKSEHIHLGIYSTLDEAAEARHKAESELFDPVLKAPGMEPTA